MHTVIETRFLDSQSSRFQNVILQYWHQHRHHNCFSSIKTFLKSLNELQLSNSVVRNSLKLCLLDSSPFFFWRSFVFKRSHVQLSAALQYVSQWKLKHKQYILLRHSTSLFCLIIIFYFVDNFVFCLLFILLLRGEFSLCHVFLYVTNLVYADVS